MKHAWLVCVGVVLLVVCGGCGSSKIVTSGTVPPSSFSVGLTNPQSLVKSGKIDDHKVLMSPDGVKIDSFAIAHDTDGPAKGTVVLLHGEGQSKLDYIDLAGRLAKRGYDSVLVDLRMHGWSGGEYITCGAKEKIDVQAAVNAYIADGTVTAEPIIAFGTTFGGATAIQYAAIEPRVKGLMVMAPWASTETKARRDLGALATPDRIHAELEKAGELAGFDPYATAAVKDAATLTCPIYIVHGTLDMVVPVAESEAIYLAVPHKQKRLQIIMPGTPEYFALIDFDTWRADRIVEVADGTFTPGRSSAGVEQEDEDVPAPQPNIPPPASDEDDLKPVKSPASLPDEEAGADDAG
ncbi:MAG: alpha/beta fold hydrolase [Planctomycetes bacterium]|jgi:alpha-beta hydrolase superfamily lysophospholipase|nr:alpha/beta fold hydrolase [Phycisphaerae bacterium]NBB94586.1 alpha/beta fold hydrolase [Planctomycetota bacterium]